MSTIKQFEELLMWQKARELTKEIYSVFRNVNDRGFKDQIQRASVSIMSNIYQAPRQIRIIAIATEKLFKSFRNFWVLIKVIIAQ